ncbi:hypothetical protein CHUAL_002763 [Chamberlinius hualienensis]
MAGEKLGLGTEVHRLRLGESFSKNSQQAFHTFRYDFKPASVDTKKMANVEIGSSNQATVTVPHIEGSGIAHTVFKGPRRPYTKECVLIIDHSTGEIVLERLSSGIQLKKTRAEGSSKMQPPTSLVEPALPQQQQLQQPIQTNKKLSPTQKYSPVQRLPPSSPGRKLSPKHLSPNRNSPPNLTQRSPANHNNQRSPSMPSLIQPSVTSSNNNNNSHHHHNSSTSSNNNKTASVAFVKEGSMPIFTIEDTNLPEPMDVAASEVGILSDSSNDSGSNSDSNSSSSSDSSDSETEETKPNSARSTSPFAISTPITQKSNAVVNGNSSSSSQKSSKPLPSMPHFTQLNEDLHLSESESD